MKQVIIEHGNGTESGSGTQPVLNELSPAKQKLIALLAKDRDQRARPIEGRQVEKSSVTAAYPRGSLPSSAIHTRKRGDGLSSAAASASASGSARVRS